ncbi:SDR family oxidoreductase [Sinimarinibacterium sp. CAU 1509]|uniref:SDR family oxidoreductase n=1 Tax=Sinimarinibacterium sp. CAU 1509 TaxID=2562283 RepID=UPI0010AC06A2|nr:SDR family oxidoreductase [Sinimarinibacterium sp. CAU 1509]TJY58773.1 SDR family oxidoreductase [Sinimarinibacterium sp. CAU 1509]
MNYFVTGATGFIGKFLLEQLLQRDGAKVYVLVRESSKDKFKALQARYGAAGKNLLPVYGDVTTPGLISAADFKKLAGKVSHVFHLAAVYDMNMDDATGDRINNEGTRNLVAFANDLGGDVRLHHVSSVAVAGGDWVGRFTEDMFDEGQRLGHPYFRTKFQSEQIVREESKVPFRIYRPGAVVGHSETGEMDKIDGPYYFFKTIQKISHSMPKWLPLLGIEGGRVPLAPVDYVTKALDYIAHQDGLDGKCFCLIQTQSPTVGELLQTIFEAAHGPNFAKKFEVPSVPAQVKQLSGRVADAIPYALKRRVSNAIGVPVSVLGYVSNLAVFDDKHTRRALKGSGIQCPNIADYAEKLWQYWELHLDLEVTLPAGAVQKLSGKVAVVTGASSGIGFTVSKKLAAAGAKVILVARTREKLEETQHIIEKAGGEAHVYPCDLNDLAAIDACSQQILADFGHVDILVNNAGRSIRRAVFESMDRFHDFERTMQLNYFGAVRMIMNFLPSMAKRRRGQIVNISSIGVLANAARFSAYVASKAALDAFSRCLSAEVKHLNIDVTAIYMPLVRTPMIAPTKLYDYVPTWSPNKAADTVIRALIDKPKSIATPLGTAAAVSYALWPKLNDYILNKGFNLFPSSSAAKGRREGAKPSLEQVVFANLFKGEYF